MADDIIPQTLYHLHTGVDSPQILYEDLSNVEHKTPVQGEILYFDGSKWVKLAPGTSGQFLKTQGADANPVWSDTDMATILGKTFIRKSIEWNGTSPIGHITIWTPATDKKFVITDLHVGMENARVRVYDNTDSLATRVATFYGGGDNLGILFNYTKPFESAAANNILKAYITGATGTVSGSLIVSGYEE